MKYQYLIFWLHHLLDFVQYGNLSSLYTLYTASWMCQIQLNVKKAICNFKCCLHVDHHPNFIWDTLVTSWSCWPVPITPKTDNIRLKITRCSDVISSTVPTQQPTPATRLFAQSFVLGADQRKHQSSVLMTNVGESTGIQLIPLTKGQWRGKCFH